MPKYGVYYIPRAESDFYRLGTSILGYDVRTECPAKMPAALHDRLGEYDRSWVQRAQPYGFHLTIGDAIDFSPSSLSAIEHEIADLVRCFTPEKPFVLQRREKDLVAFWGGQKEIVVLRYEANVRLQLFHSLIVARVNPLGHSSGYLRRHLEDPSGYGEQPQHAQRILKFYAPFVLDDYAPHFTLMNPYGGKDWASLEHALRQIFEPFSVIHLESICLLVQMETDGMWSIHREFRLCT